MLQQAPLNDSRADRAARRHGRSWLLLVAGLAVHVADEALTGFLEFYNPLVLAIRARVPWFPMPTFEFDVWVAALVVLVVCLASMGRAVRRGATGTYLASWVFSGLMFLNGVGHLTGSVYFQRWLPGATSAPLLIVLSVLLARAAFERGELITMQSRSVAADGH